MLKLFKEALEAFKNAVAEKKADAELTSLKAKALELKGKLTADDLKGIDITILEDKADGSDDSDSDTDAVVTEEALKGIVTNAVAEGIKTAGAESKVDEAKIAGAVAEAIKRHEPSKTEAGFPVAAVAPIATEAVKVAMSGVRMDKKALHNADDANNGGNGGEGGTREGAKSTRFGGTKSYIEIPYAWCRGNLPLHGKQLLNILMGRPQNDGGGHSEFNVSPEEEQTGIKMADGIFGNAKMKQSAKALTSTGAATGDELVPTDLSGELQRRMYLESELAQLFLAREIEMPTNPFNLPLSTTRPTFKLESTENTAATASDPGTAQVVLTAVKMMAEVDYSYELNEDSIIAILPMVQTLLAEAAADALEDALINGDTTGTHQDSDTNAVSKHVAKSWKGFRKLALAGSITSDWSSGNISRANLIAGKKLMGKFGTQLRNLVWITGPNGSNDFLGLDDVVTVDKRGLAATTLTGVLPSFLGIPIVVSAQNREDLNASGVYDAITTTKGSLLLVNLGEFFLGNRRGFMIEVDRNIKTQTNEIVASFRKAFIPKETPSTSIATVAMGYNFTA